MTKIRNIVLFCLLLLIWLYVYVPNRLHPMANGNGPPNVDLLFLWLPAVLGISAYVLFNAIWWRRLILSLVPPLSIVAIVYVAGILGSVSSEYAASTIRVVLFALPSYTIALLVCVAIIEVTSRLRARRRSP